MTQRRNSEIVEYTGTTPNIPILFEDDYVIVIDKPANVLSQGDITGDASIPNLLQQYRSQSGHSGNQIHLLHRLDRPVSGLMILAKRSDAAKHLSKQFKEHRIRKSYWAVCEGELPRTGVLQHWLEKREHPVHVVVHPKERSTAKKAILSFRKLEEIEDKEQKLTLAEIHLQTGRPHQIRAQLSFNGNPIVGDVKYGSHFNNTSIHLRSVMLEFEHPKDGSIVRLESYPDPQEHWKSFTY
jgi:23S rRNA pseudouridine1911/1915/1917 synthase